MNGFLFDSEHQIIMRLYFTEPTLHLRQQTSMSLRAKQQNQVKFNFITWSGVALD